MRRLVLSLALLSAIALVPPAGAGAQVYVDPNSPAGKEYAIPLDEARDKSQTESGDLRKGVEAAAAANDGRRGSGGKSKDAKSRKRNKSGQDNGDTQAVVADDSGGGSSGGSSPDEAGADGALLTSGIALAVLLLGGGIAFLMRRGAFGTDA